MKKWTTEIAFKNCIGSGVKFEPITRFEDEDTETMLTLCKLGGGVIIYDGYNAFVNKPVVDPIQRKIWYTVEIYDRAAP